MNERALQLVDTFSDLLAAYGMNALGAVLTLVLTQLLRNSASTTRVSTITA